MVELLMFVTCTCGRASNIPITESGYTDENEVDLSSSIEHYSEGRFHCLQNDPDTMKINCTSCGKSTYLQY